MGKRWKMLKRIAENKVIKISSTKKSTTASTGISLGAATVNLNEEYSDYDMTYKLKYSQTTIGIIYTP